MKKEDEDSFASVTFRERSENEEVRYLSVEELRALLRGKRVSRHEKDQ